MEHYTRIFDQKCFELNPSVLNDFESLTDDDFKEKTHMFNGRYENLYVDAMNISGLDKIINTAIENAAMILNVEKNNIKYGYWLNAMKPGDVTTAHTHDDDDELLSCVYYIKVPEDSGNLILTQNNKKTVVKPEEGVFVFFSPEILHEVSPNNSNETRLSIAFNFGKKVCK